jgi:hypothetical protein
MKNIKKIESTSAHRADMDITDIILEPIREAQKKAKIERIKQKTKSFLLYFVLIVYWIFAGLIWNYFYHWHGRLDIDIITFIVFIILWFGIPFFVDFLIKKYKIKIIKKTNFSLK